MSTISLLPVATSVTQDDLVLIVNDPNGTPVTQKARVSDIISLATTVLAGATWKGTWGAGTTYAAADTVSLSGDVYISLLGTNLNQTPASSPTYWQKLVAQGPIGDPGTKGDDGDAGSAGLPSSFNAAQWTAGTYAKGTAVLHADGSTYVAVVDSATQNPSTNHGSGDNWRMISQRGLIGPKPFTVPTVWAATGGVYTAGDANTPASSVFHTDASYVCLTSHTTASSVFATDVTAGKWQMIAAPGGVAGISATLPLAVNNSNPTLPALSIAQDAAGGVPILTASGVVPPKERPSWYRRFRYADVKTGSGNEAWGSYGAGVGYQGASVPANWLDGDGGFTNGVEICRIVVPGDAESTGANVYNRRIELNASITSVVVNDNAVIYYSWFRYPTGVSDRVKVPPTVTSCQAATVGFSSNRWVCTQVTAVSDPLTAANDSTFVLVAAVLNDVVEWNWGPAYPGRDDAISAKVVPVS
jgi:hypothetical protein